MVAQSMHVHSFRHMQPICGSFAVAPASQAVHASKPSQLKRPFILLVFAGGKSVTKIGSPPPKSLWVLSA